MKNTKEGQRKFNMPLLSVNLRLNIDIYDSVKKETAITAWSDGAHSGSRGRWIYTLRFCLKKKKLTSVLEIAQKVRACAHSDPYQATHSSSRGPVTSLWALYVHNQKQK